MLHFLLVLNFYVGTACNRASFSIQFLLVLKSLKQP